MENSDQRNNLGLKVLSELWGENYAENYAQGIKSGGFGSQIGALGLEFLFGEVWSSDVLEKRHRSMVTLGALIALGRFDEIQQHVRAGLNNGLTVAELEAIILQTIPYAGFPAGATALKAAQIVLRERGLLGEGSITERGLI